MKTENIILLAIFITFMKACSAYRILGLYPLPKQSHFNMFNQLFKALAKKGHQIDLISMSPFEESYPNYKQIFMLPDNPDPVFTHYDKIKDMESNVSLVAWMGYLRCQAMESSNFLRFVQNPPKDPPYDLIITQMLERPCYMILGHLWNIPTVLLSTSSLYPYHYDMIGNPEYPSFLPNNFFPLTLDGSFSKRFYNTYLFYKFKFNYLYYSQNQNELLQKLFGPNVPSIRELERSASLVLINTYFPINGVKPSTTGLIEVGGLHIQNDGPELSKDLKKWMDESKHGVIYFSLGSIFSLDVFSGKFIDTVFKSLEKLAPMKVLMRVKNPGKLTAKVPDNVKTMSWIPQEKVLQHPNVKVFVTHSGLFGSQEAIYYGVPMVCLPFAFDQFNNADNYVKKKIAVKVDLKSVTQDKLDHALNEVLSNPIYKENIKKLSRLFRDRPLSAIDTAIYWIEYVIRNGNDPLRSPMMDMTWWQIALVDVYAAVLFGLFIFIYLVSFVIRTFLRTLAYKSDEKILKKKRN